MVRKIYNKSEFVNMTPETLNTWIVWHKGQLVGSAVFTSSDSIISKLVSWAESWKNKKAEFKPSHVGSIVEKDGTFYVFDMSPPAATKTPLVNFLLNASCDYKLVLRDFNINARWFSEDILYHLGEFYPFLSAIRSVFTKRNTKFVNHCSELHIRNLQKQGLFINFNAECTPLELYELLTKEEK